LDFSLGLGVFAAFSHARVTGASLVQSVELIRSHGLKSRMCEPQEFITKINRLSATPDICRALSA